jgi:hypothetical protein
MLRQRPEAEKFFKITGMIFLLVISITGKVFSQQAIPSGTARFEALGFNPYIMDAAIDLDRNPAWGNKYNNYTFGDLGRYTQESYTASNGSGTYLIDSNYNLRNQYLGVNFRLGDEWSVGVILNKPEGEIYNSDMRVYYSYLGNGAPIVPFKALAAYNTSRTVTLGFAPYFAFWNYSINANDTKYNLNIDRSTSTVGGTFGILDKMNSGWTEATVGIKFNNYSYDSTFNGKTTSFENDGGLEFNAGYRGWYRIKDSKVNIVPFMNFSLFNWQPTIIENVYNVSQESNSWKINLGVGVNIPITEDGMFAGGVSGGYNTNSFSYSDSAVNSAENKIEGITFPQFNIGMEWNLTDWLQGRFGYSRSVIRNKYKYTNSQNSTYFNVEVNQNQPSNPDQTITAGLGMQFGGFSLDGLIGERYIQSGPNVLSGSNNDLYGVVSISYNFKKY